jgi:hypothetical protein
MDDPILTTDDSRPLRVLGYAGLWADALRSMIAPPRVLGYAGLWADALRSMIAPPARARVRGPLGRCPTVDDRAPREC